MAVVLQFAFETLTDLSVAPSLVLIYARRRHWEFFVGVAQFAFSLLYNLCHSLDVSFVLTKEQWHELTNVMGLAYGANVLVYLMNNRDEGLNHLVRYSAFAALWVAQIKDEYWMHKSQWTLGLLIVLVLFVLVKVLANRSLWRQYRKDKFRNGALLALAAFIFFVVSLDDNQDPFRWKHGTAQLFFGAALYQLWQVVADTPAALLPSSMAHNM